MPIQWWMCGAFCAGALLLYWPALRIGLLSDDFVLTIRAIHFQYGFANPEFFRPLPLLAWTALLHAGAGATGLHLTSVLLHGVVACLTVALAMPFAASRMQAVLAGLLVLAFPASVEPVSWASGVFDVSATALIISAVLIGRRYVIARCCSRSMRASP